MRYAALWLAFSIVWGSASAADIIHFTLAGSLQGAQFGYPAMSGLSLNADVSGTGGPTGQYPYIFRFSGNSATNRGTASYTNEVDYSRGFTNPRNTGSISHPFALDSLFLESAAFGSATALLTFHVYSLSGIDSYRLDLTASGQTNGSVFVGFSNNAFLQTTSRAGPVQRGSFSMTWNSLTPQVNAPIPEPSSLALGLAGLLAIFAGGVRNRRVTSPRRATCVVRRCINAQ